MILVEKYLACVDGQINKTTQSRVVLQERGRRYCLTNSNNSWQITKVRVEHCIMTEIGEKGCEAILIAEAEKENRAYYVELKGVSVNDAFKQIENSLAKTVADLNGAILFGRIIPSAYKRNKFLETQEKRLILRFKSLGGNFIVREN